MRCLKTWPVILITLLLVGAAPAQQKPAQPAPPDDPAQSIRQWMKDNLDDDVLQMLDQIDQDRVRDFFTKLQQQFDGTNIYELGSLKEIALQVLPVLKEFEETQPYAAWLQAHLDDLDAANEVQREMKATFPKPEGADFPARAAAQNPAFGLGQGIGETPVAAARPCLRAETQADFCV